MAHQEMGHFLPSCCFMVQKVPGRGGAIGMQLYSPRQDFWCSLMATQQGAMHGKLVIFLQTGC